MDLYIGNSTRMTFRHNYRIPEGALRHIVIGSGRQEVIKDLSNDQYDHIYGDLVRRHGAKTPADLNKTHSRFDGFIVSDKPISEHVLRYGFEEYMETSQDRSVTEATRTALSSHNIDNPKRGRGRPRKSTTVEMEQEGDDKDKNKIKMSVEVSDDGASQIDKKDLPTE